MAKSKVKDSDVLAYLQERKQGLRDELEKIETMLSVVGASSKSAIKKGKKKGKKKLDKAVKSIRKKVAQAIEGAKAKAGALVDSITSSGDEETVVQKRRATSKKEVAKAETPSAPVTKPEAPSTKVNEAKGRKAKGVPTTTSLSKAPIATETPAKRTRTRQVAKPSVPSNVSAETAQVTTRQASAEKAATPKAPKKPATVASKAAADKKATVKAVLASFDPKAKMDDKIRFALAQKKNSTKAEVIDYLNNLEPEYGLTKLKKVVAFRLNHLLKTGQVKGQERKDGFRYAAD